MLLLQKLSNERKEIIMLDEHTLFTAIEKNELKMLLRGDDPYKVESSQYAPGGEITDVGKVLSTIIYKAYKVQPCIKEKIEMSLLEMLHQTNFDFYIVILYVISQLFKEKNGISPFRLNMSNILAIIKLEVKKRENVIKHGIIYPSGFINQNAWYDIERFNRISQEEYGIELF